MTKLKDGQGFRVLEIRHGNNKRVLINGTVRVFEQDGEDRYEVTADEMTTGQDEYGSATGHSANVTVGIDPDNIVRID